jgi:lysophospholipase L1-like esterase
LKLVLLFLSVSLPTFCLNLLPLSNPASTAESKNISLWMDYHERYVQEAKKGDIDVLFLGASIVAQAGAQESLKDKFGTLRVGTFGIPSDQTQNLLWRVRNGELDGISPRYVVIMVGGNNPESPKLVAEGIRSIVSEVRNRLPNSDVLLYGVFPREQFPGQKRSQILSLNSILKTFDDQKAVHFIDITNQLLDKNGILTQEMAPDFVHPSAKGFGIWFDSIVSHVQQNSRVAELDQTDSDILLANLD